VVSESFRRPVFHQEALGAAARITGLGLGVLACAPSDGSATARAGSAADGVPAAPATEPSIAEPGPVAEEPAPVDPLAACRETTRAAFDDAQQLRPDHDAEAVKACCDMIAKSIDAHLGEEPDPISAWTERNACCSQLEWQGSTACTPWGPPAPPTTEHEAVPSVAPVTLDLREAARAELESRGLSISAPSNPQVRAAAVSTWLGRMVNETVSARVFTAVADQLREAGFADSVVQEWSSFAAEERRHGVVCGAVVEALGGHAVADVESHPELASLPGVPRHPDTSARASALRNVMSISAFSETVAVSLIGAERLQMPPGPLRDRLTEIWADEIGHANAGWRLLRDELGADSEGALARDLLEYLPVAVDDLLRHELEHLPADFTAPPGGERYGLCDGREARRLFTDTLQRVIAPALGQLLSPGLRRVAA
jgi:hypothetical protein